MFHCFPLIFVNSVPKIEQGKKEESVINVHVLSKIELVLVTPEYFPIIAQKVQKLPNEQPKID